MAALARVLRQLVGGHAVCGGGGAAAAALCSIPQTYSRHPTPLPSWLPCPPFTCSQSAVHRPGSNDTAFPWRGAMYRLKARCVPLPFLLPDADNWPALEGLVGPAAFLPLPWVLPHRASSRCWCGLHPPNFPPSWPCPLPRRLPAGQTRRLISRCWTGRCRRCKRWWRRCCRAR